MTLGPLTLLRPEALWWLALAVPLVVLHLRLTRRRRVEVTSVRLWVELPGRGLARRGLRAPSELLALLLGLLAVAALAIGMAEPVTGTLPPPGRSLVVVVDASASMNARTDGVSRLDEARAAALLALDELAPGDDVTVWVDVDGPVALVSPTRDTALARRAIQELHGTLSTRRLAETLAAARRALDLRRVNGHVLVITDAPGADAMSAQSLGEAPGATVARVGEADVVNAAITDVALGPSSTVVVRVDALEGSPGGRRVELLAADAPTVLAGADVSLARGGSERVLLFPGDATGILRVRLTSADDARSADAFPDDDIAAIHVPRVSPLRVAVVARDGRASPFVRAVLSALGDRVDAAGSVVTTPDVGPGVLAMIDVVLADGVLPHELAAGVPVLAFVEEGEIVERPLLWGAAEHPVLDGVDLAPLRIDRAAVRAAAPGEDVLVDTASGPVAVVRGGPGARRVNLRFRPAASTLPVEPAFPLLVRNALEWLVDRDASPAVVRAGAPVPLPEDERVEGAVLTLSVGDSVHPAPLGADGAEPLAPLPRPGGGRVLRVAREGGATIFRTGLLWNLPAGARLGAAGPPRGLVVSEALTDVLPPRASTPPRREHAGAFAAAAAVLVALGALVVGPLRRS